MFIRKKAVESTKLDEVIEEALSHLSVYDDDYHQNVETLKELYKMKAQDQPVFRPSSDTILTVAANLVGIVLILNHEKAGIVTSKAVGFLTKIR